MRDGWAGQPPTSPPWTAVSYACFEEHYTTKGLLHSDPPDHTRLRRFTGKAFSPRRIEAIKPYIAEVARSLLDKCADQGGMEVIGGLASALPVAVLCELMGLPASDQYLLHRWADQLLGFQGVNKPALDLLLAAQSAIVEIRQYLGELLQARRKDPGTDLLSAFVMAETEPQGLSETEIINTCQTLLVAGHETTTSLIGNGLALLLGDRGQWQRLVDDRSLVRSAIEEIVRYESPVARQPRRVTEPVQLGEVPISGGRDVVPNAERCQPRSLAFREPGPVPGRPQPQPTLGLRVWSTFLHRGAVGSRRGRGRLPGPPRALPDLEDRRPCAGMGQLESELPRAVIVDGHLVTRGLPSSGAAIERARTRARRFQGQRPAQARRREADKHHYGWPYRDVAGAGPRRRAGRRPRPSTPGIDQKAFRGKKQIVETFSETSG